MNSYERVMNRFAGKKVDRLPNFSIVMMFAAKQGGITYGEYITDHKKFSDIVYDCHKRFGFDVLSAISDPMREAEGFGTKVVIHNDKAPSAVEKRVREISDIGTLKTYDPHCSKRTFDRICGVARMKELAKGEVPVMGWVEGAFAEACDLMNMQELFACLIEDPEPIEELLDICLEEAILFAGAQIDAGAEIIGVGDAAASLIGPSLYEEYALPYEKKLFDAIHAKGAKVKLHICGNITPLLEMISQSGADMVDLDYMVDMNKAAQIFPRNICLCGNFNPVSVVLQGTPEDVRYEVRRCKELDAVNNVCIAPGCEIPKDTDPRNVMAIQEAIEGC